MADVDVYSEIVIARPYDQVTSYAANPDNAPEWYVNIKSVEWTTSPPAVVGSQIKFVAHFLGRSLEYTYEIIELNSGERLVMCTAEGPFSMETSYCWKAINELSTLISLRIRGRPSGFSAFIAPFMPFNYDARANRKDLARLKKILEVENAVAT